MSATRSVTTRKVQMNANMSINAWRETKKTVNHRFTEKGITIFKKYLKERFNPPISRTKARMISFDDLGDLVDWWHAFVEILRHFFWNFATLHRNALGHISCLDRNHLPNVSFTSHLKLRSSHKSIKWSLLRTNGWNLIHSLYLTPAQPCSALSI
jgi:hypothetical protein